MKKLIAILLTLALVLTFAACGQEKPDETKGTEPAGTTAPAVEDTTAAPTDDTTAPAEVSVMTYAEYAAAELDTAVVIDVYVQNTQSWWNDQITVYAADADGGYFLYNMACSEEDAAKLVPGTKIRVTGYKTAWAGEVEVAEGATFEFIEGADTFIAEAEDMTALLGTDELIDNQNKFVAFKGMTVEACNDNGDAFQYNWDGSGQEGTDSDLYFNASVNGQTYTFVIEYYLTNHESDAYKAVQNLKVGDVIDMEGFLYWYDGVQPHITSVTVAE